jgi:hypothetical protein
MALARRQLEQALKAALKSESEIRLREYAAGLPQSLAESEEGKEGGEQK